jgi:hypothetical protein
MNPLSDTTNQYNIEGCLNLEASFEHQLMKPSFRKVVLSSSSSSSGSCCSKSIRKKSEQRKYPHPKNLDTASDIWPVNCDLAIKPLRPKKSIVDVTPTFHKNKILST